tara:strand:+ start:372 stop:740 length:369 start_codon:yes stop_codon:yes gene_type:complete
MREIGDKLEDRVLDELEGVVSSCHKTAGSGSFHDNGDIIVEGPGLLIECKYRNKPNITLEKKVMDKVERQAARTGKDWVVVSENSDGDTIASMRLDTLLHLISLWKEAEKDESDKTDEGGAR